MKSVKVPLKRAAKEVEEEEKNGEMDSEVLVKSSKKMRKRVVKKDNKYHEDNAEKFESNMCHQCQKNSKGRVVRCQNCKKKCYCFTCLATWYPRTPDEDIAKKCPFCLNTCNCRLCLCLDTNVDATNSELSKDESIQYSKYILQRLLPFLKEINQEQIAEKEFEA